VLGARRLGALHNGGCRPGGNRRVAKGGEATDGWGLWGGRDRVERKLTSSIPCGNP
jgi:hypothetical protein